MEYDDDLDARGLLCPLPVLKLRKRLKNLAPDAVLRVRADDPAARIDIPHFCAQSGHSLLDMTDTESEQTYFLRKSAPVPR